MPEQQCRPLVVIFSVVLDVVVSHSDDGGYLFAS